MDLLYVTWACCPVLKFVPSLFQPRPLLLCHWSGCMCSSGYSAFSLWLLWGERGLSDAATHLPLSPGWCKCIRNYRGTGLWRGIACGLQRPGTPCKRKRVRQLFLGNWAEMFCILLSVTWSSDISPCIWGLESTDLCAVCGEIEDWAIDVWGLEEDRPVVDVSVPTSEEKAELVITRTDLLGTGQQRQASRTRFAVCQDWWVN